MMTTMPIFSLGSIFERRILVKKPGTNLVLSRILAMEAVGSFVRLPWESPGLE